MAANELNKLKKRMSLSDAALGSLVGSDQSSVYRALHREPPAWTPTMHKLWNYAKKHGLGVSLASPETGNADKTSESAKLTLVKAAVAAWDETPDGLERLLRLLQVASELQGCRK